MNDKTRYINREISWLSFNERVLQEAADPDTPLIERIKFLGIFSSNLDEFFRVRVATITRLMKARKKIRALLGEDPKQILAAIQKTVRRQQNRFDEIYSSILASLAEKHIHLIDEKDLGDGREAFIHDYFINEVRPLLFPVMIDKLTKTPVLKDHAIYLAVRMSRNGDPATFRHAIIEVPAAAASRFVVLPKEDGNTYIMLLDDVIRYGLPSIFAMFDCTQYDAYTIKLTRDAELDIADDITTSYFEQVSRSLKQRRSGEPVRFIYDSALPDDFLNLLHQKLKLTATDTLLSGGRYHNFKDFMAFPPVGPSSLRYQAMTPLPHRDINPEISLFDIIRKKDLLLNFPYHSFHHFIDLLREASIDPNVEAIKITIYRAATNSKVINALINASRNGKSVTVVLELQARFDEEANIYWTTRLREEGVKIIHGVPDLKVHCKLCLITRRDREGVRRYACIGTGNFNESTARVYSDHSLFSSDSRLTGEVEKIFEFFKHNYKTSQFSHLLVSPFYLRKKLTKLVDNEIRNARKGKEASILLKMNSLMDKDLIDKLYEASRAGVSIRMIVRGICSLVPGIEGISENISIVSIVDRFLEHSRIFVFHNGGEELYYISSADWMTRNLDRRVEVVCPIYDRAIKKELMDFFDLQFRDNTKAREINESQNNHYVKRKPDEQKVRAQFDHYEYLKNKLIR